MAGISPSLPPTPSPPLRPLFVPGQGIKVLVAGATGGVGRAVVRQLVAQGVPVRALVRDGVKAAGLLPAPRQGVETVEGDVYKFSTLPKAMEGM